MDQVLLSFIAILLLAAPWTYAQSTDANGEAQSLQVANAPSYYQPSYQPISGAMRMKWFVKSTVGPESLAAGLFSSAIGTARDDPFEYGSSWEGFGKRYGMRFTGVATSNAMEAGLGALWGEDPRYVRAVHKPFGGRVKNIIAMTFMAERRDGELRPAYARFIAIPGSNFLSNTWRADSEASAQDAAVRSILGFAGHMGANAFAEFWPSAKKHIFHKRSHNVAAFDLSPAANR